MLHIHQRRTGRNIPDENEKHPADAECLARSAPGRSARASLRPQDAARAEPSQVQCCPWSEFDPKAQHNIVPKRNQPHICGADFFLESGNVLLSRAVSSQVPSALKGLTSVFGMGTGGSLSPLSPECFQGAVQSAFFLASASSIYNQSFRLGELPYNCALFYCAYPENRTSRSLHLVKNQSLTSIFPLVSLDSQFL